MTISAFSPVHSLTANPTGSTQPVPSSVIYRAKRVPDVVMIRFGKTPETKQTEDNKPKTETPKTEKKPRGFWNYAGIVLGGLGILAAAGLGMASVITLLPAVAIGAVGAILLALGIWLRGNKETTSSGSGDPQSAEKNNSAFDGKTASKNKTETPIQEVVYLAGNEIAEIKADFNKIREKIETTQDKYAFSKVVISENEYNLNIIKDLKRLMGLEIEEDNGLRFNLVARIEADETLKNDPTIQKALEEFKKDFHVKYIEKLESNLKAIAELSRILNIRLNDKETPEDKVKALSKYPGHLANAEKLYNLLNGVLGKDGVTQQDGIQQQISNILTALEKLQKLSENKVGKLGKVDASTQTKTPLKITMARVNQELSEIPADLKLIIDKTEKSTDKKFAFTKAPIDKHEYNVKIVGDLLRLLCVELPEKKGSKELRPVPTVSATSIDFIKLLETAPLFKSNGALQTLIKTFKLSFNAEYVDQLNDHLNSISKLSTVSNIQLKNNETADAKVKKIQNNQLTGDNSPTAFCDHLTQAEEQVQKLITNLTSLYNVANKLVEEEKHKA